MSLSRVRKRDGREVPFDETKIREAVAAALAAAGEEDPTFAGEVAALVRMTLEHRAGEPGRGLPHIEEIQDLVEQALIELGRARVAKAYILYRDRRARVRAALRVEQRADARLPDPAASGEAPRTAPRGLRVVESESTSPWSKGRIVAALMNEADLERATAEEVAARVEKHVFGAGLRRISTALIRELVDNELVDLGLNAQLERQGSLGIPRHDLRELLSAHPRVEPGREISAGVAESVANVVLRRYALEEIFPPEVCDRHLSGDLDLVGADRPHLHLISAVPADLMLRSEPSPQAAFDLLGELARVARSTAHGVVLEDPARALAPLLRGARGAGLREWLAALASVAAASGRRLDLGTPGVRGTAVARALVEERAELSAEGAARIFVDVDELAALYEEAEDGEPVALLDELVGSGALVATWGSVGERFAGPGCRRAARERAAVHCGGAVALNLPRLARRAGPWREERVLADVLALVELACDALAAQRTFQERTRAARAGEVRGRVMYAVAPVGLREALRILGDGEVRAEQGARILGLVSDALRRLGADRRLAVVPTPLLGAAAAYRFAELDRASAAAVQEVLFADVGPGADAARRRAYGEGWRLAASVVPLAAETRLLSTVPSGAIAPPPRHLVSTPERPGGRARRAEVWRAFGADRAEPERLQSSADLTPHPSLFDPTPAAAAAAGQVDPTAPASADPR